MKKILTLAVLFFVFTSVNAQDEDTTKVIGYAGLVGMGSVQMDSGSTSKFTNFRVGMKVTTQTEKGFSYIGWISYDPGDGLILFESKLRKAFGFEEKFGFTVGYEATPVTLIRPFPLSVDGQFEFAAESMPPGGGLGFTVWCGPIKAGYHTRSGRPEWQLAVDIGPDYKVGLWSIGKKAGGTIQAILPKVYIMISVASENINKCRRNLDRAIALAVQPLNNFDCKVVCDLALRGNGTKNVFTNAFVGLQRPMKIEGLTDPRFGLGYDFVKRSFGAFFLVSIKTEKKIALD